MTSLRPHSRIHATNSRALRGHPLRSLFFSTLCHAIVALILAMIQVKSSTRGARRPSTRWTSVVLTVAPPSARVEYEESTEELEQLAALDPASELPEEFQGPALDTWFAEPARGPAPSTVLSGASGDAFDQLPEDLFTEPERAVPEPEAAPVEPTPGPEPEPAPPVVEPVEPAEPAEPEAVPDTVEPAEQAEAESDPTPASEGPADEAETSGDDLEDSYLVAAPAPDYPASARRQRKQGTVELAIQVDADGTVVSVKVLSSSGHRVLDEAARQGVLDSWKFRAKREDEPDLRRFREAVIFRLL